MIVILGSNALNPEEFHKQRFELAHLLVARYNLTRQRKPRRSNGTKRPETPRSQVRPR